MLSLGSARLGLQPQQQRVPSAAAPDGPDGLRRRALRRWKCSSAVLERDAARLWRREDWAAAYQDYEESAEDAEGYWLEREAGQVPPNLCGTLYRHFSAFLLLPTDPSRNGPGEFRVGGTPLAHPFDGTGLVASFAFRDGRAFFRARLVATPEREQERRAGRILYRSTFGTEPGQHWPSRALDLLVRNPGNTGVLPLGDRCLALFEAGQPYRLDSQTLETHGLDYLDGALSPGLPFSSGSRLVDTLVGWLLTGLRRLRGHPGGVRLGGEALGAHTRTVPATGHTLLFSYQLLLGGWPMPRLKTRVTLRTYNRDQQLVGTSQQMLDGYAFLHDVAVTENHVVAFQNAVDLDVAAFVLGLASPVHSVRWRRRPLTVHLWPHPSGPSPQQQQHQQNYQPPPEPERSKAGTADAAPSPAVIQHLRPAQLRGMASAAFVFHLANAYEVAEPPGDGGRSRIVVDCVRYPSMPDFHQACGAGRSFISDVDPAAQPPAELWRYTLCGATGAVTDERRLSPWAAEFPAVSPNCAGGQHRFVFAAAAPVPGVNLPQQALLRVDTAPGGRSVTWSPGERWYVGEPVLVPKQGAPGQPLKELDAWVLVLAFDAAQRSSHLLIFDAGAVEEGPVARLRLRKPLPHGLHGAWSEACHAPPV